MVEKETEKINSAVLKYFIMFVVIISLAGVTFKFVFLNMILRMGKPEVKVDSLVVAVQEKKKIVLSASKNEYKIIGIVDNHYIVKTHKGLKKVKIDMKNKRNINDEIKIVKF